MTKSKQKWEKHNHQCQYCGEITYWQHDNPNFETLADDACGKCCRAVSIERQRVVEMILGEVDKMSITHWKDKDALIAAGIYNQAIYKVKCYLQSKLEEK